MYKRRTSIPITPIFTASRLLHSPVSTRIHHHLPLPSITKSSFIKHVYPREDPSKLQPARPAQWPHRRKQASSVLSLWLAWRPLSPVYLRRSRTRTLHHPLFIWYPIMTNALNVEAFQVKALKLRLPEPPQASALSYLICSLSLLLKNMLRKLDIVTRL